MTAAALLDRLSGVRERGPGRWIACCPAHEDRSPSLSIRADGDTVLLHCWAGCAAADVVAAVGLSLADLFPRDETRYQHDRGGRRPPGISAGDALRLLRRETAVVALAAADLTAGHTLAAEDHARLRTAAARIAHVAGGVS